MLERHGQPGLPDRLCNCRCSATPHVSETIVQFSAHLVVFNLSLFEAATV